MTKGSERNLGSDGYVHYLDRDDVVTGENSHGNLSCHSNRVQFTVRQEYLSA